MPYAPLSGISVCVFDAYGTLFNLQAMAGNCRAALGERAETLIELWRRKQLEYTWLRSLMGRHTDFWHVTGESLDHALAALEVADPALRARLMEGYLTPTAYGDAKQALVGLKAAGHRTAILSNGSPSMLTAATKAAGLDELLDAVLSVESVGVFKPHPSVYALASAHFQCAPAEIGFVTSNGWDAAGASAYGFRVVWVNRAGLPRDILPASPHLEVESLSRLPELFPR
jgi:2-haloacid dehalogenase